MFIYSVFRLESATSAMLSFHITILMAVAFDQSHILCVWVVCECEGDVHFLQSLYPCVREIKHHLTRPVVYNV